jgi:hypothetical protein
VLERTLTHWAFPWRDLFAQPVLVGAMRTALLGAATCMVAGLLLWLAPADEASRVDVDYHGRAAPWLRRAGWFAVGVGAVGALMGRGYLAFINHRPDPMLPASAWWTGWVLLSILVAILLARRPVKASPPKPAPEQAKVESALVRTAWERFLYAQGFSLLRAGDRTGAGAPVVAQGHSAQDRWRVARDPGRIDRDHYLFPAGDPAAAAWRHQARFVEAVREAASVGGGRAVLMHSARGSGRSVAVFEAALEAKLARGGTSLLVYPDRLTARRARDQLLEQLAKAAGRVAQRPAVVLMGEDGFVRPSIAICAADQLESEFLARASVDSVRDFLRGLRLLALEDIEAHSGARATNLALMLRRLHRILSRENGAVVMALTSAANPGENTGVQEFAQWLSAPCRLVEGAIRDDAPLRDTHVYLLDVAPKLPDAQGVDALPAVQQVAWATAAWGAPVNIAPADGLTESDHPEPAWAPRLRERADGNRPLTPPTWARSRAFVLVREVPLRGFFSATETVVHGAIDLPQLGAAQLTSDGAVVVLVPALADRPLVQWLARHWIAASVDELGKAPGTWQGHLMPIGSRLVAGNPGRELLRRHLEAAINECPGTEDDLQTLVSLPDSYAQGTGRELLSRLLRDLREQQMLVSARSRRLPPGATEPVFDQEWALSVPRMVSTPIDAVTTTTVRLVARESRGAHRDIRQIDRAHVLRTAHPGALLYGDGVRYRVIVESFLDGWQRASREEDGEAGAEGGVHEERWVECEAVDTHACTEAETERDYLDVRRSKAEQSSRHAGGLPFHYWRAEFRLRERHVGYWELRDDGTGLGLQASYHRWAGSELVSEHPAQALVVALPTVMTPEGRATLRRIVATTMRALVDIPAGDLIVDVAERIGGLEAAGTLLLIVDPAAGGAGLLDSLGASPFRFLENLFVLAGDWAEDLALRSSASWPEIGFAGARFDEGESLAPNPGEVASLLRALLGKATLGDGVPPGGEGSSSPEMYGASGADASTAPVPAGDADGAGDIGEVELAQAAVVPVPVPPSPPTANPRSDKPSPREAPVDTGSVRSSPTPVEAVVAAPAPPDEGES